MDKREILLDFLKFHYKNNPFRKKSTNEKDVDTYLLSVGYSLPLNKCNECGQQLEEDNIYGKCTECYFNNTI